MMRKKGAMILLAAMMTVGGIGATTVKAEDYSDYYVGFAAPLTSGEYWNSLTTATEDKFDEAGIKINIQSAETDMEKQAELVNNFVTMGATHIIVDPCDPTSIESVLVDAREAGAQAAWLLTW